MVSAKCVQYGYCQNLTRISSAANGGHFAQLESINVAAENEHFLDHERTHWQPTVVQLVASAADAERTQMIFAEGEKFKTWSHRSVLDTIRVIYI
jgi:hypothetical protein